MIYINRIIQVDINIGDLVFIHHIEKPYKSGWWRYVRTPKGAYYVLERPVHKQFDTIKIDGNTYYSCPKMKASTLSCGLSITPNHKNTSTKKGYSSYEILFVARNEASAKLPFVNYDLDKLSKTTEFGENDILCSDRGVLFLELLNPATKEENTLLDIADNYSL